MSKTFLSEEQWEKAKGLFPPIFWTPNGDVRFASYFGGPQFSAWLGSQLEEKLKSFPDFVECEPVMLGSWSRNELCPNSDIDLLFSGDHTRVKALVDRLHEAGLKIRYRVPADASDWSVGVQSFDVLALWKAKPLSTASAAKLFQQQKRLWENKKNIRAKILKDLLAERKQRAERYNSISNYLEPNLKYGPGGLRDIEQAQQVYDLFAEKFPHAGHAMEVLNYYKTYFLTLRQNLHLMGYGDVLVNTAQFDLAKTFNFENHKEFMRDLERGLSRTYFYADWIFAFASASPKKIQQTAQLRLRKPDDLFQALKKDPSPLVQHEVRESLNAVLPQNLRAKKARWSGKILQELLAPQTAREVVQGVFQSRLIDKILPAMKHLVGYVQHDQYHRYTADVHIMQAVLYAKDVFRQPKRLGALKPLHGRLGPEDWRILSWACLYHDLAKGLEADDHSDEGVAIVRRDFKAYGFSQAFTDEVAWIVQNHLELSIAAFRKNPKSRSTWEDLESKGVSGARLRRLAIFTVIDICATNPEAWNDWKSRLLKELVDVLESKSTQDYFTLKQTLKKKKLVGIEDLLQDFDVFLIESLSAAVLGSDIQRARAASRDLPPLVYQSPRRRAKAQEVWVRFHSRTDRPGLLAGYVQQLYGLGASVRHAAIQTLPGVGVYDWFQIQSAKKPMVLEKMLSASESLPPKLPAVEYDEISLVSKDPEEWVLSFTGKDQPGFLATATAALAASQVQILSARVHTWGRQVNDLFAIKAPENQAGSQDEAVQKLLHDLRTRVELPS
jgi:[protein-PII] uridylyltransferase